MSIHKLIRDTPESIGNRIKSIRMLAGYDSREEFAQALEISTATIRAWEEPGKGRNGITDKGAKRLLSALAANGISCSMEYLLTGHGFGAKLINAELSSNYLPDIENNDWSEEELIIKEIEYFKQIHKDSIVAIINDGSMLPTYAYGDYVAGDKVYDKDIMNLIGLDCIIETEKFTIVRRIISGDGKFFTLLANNQESNHVEPVIDNVEIQSAAEIIWHRKKMKIKDIKV